MARSSRDAAMLLLGLGSPRHSGHDPRVPPLPIPDPDLVDLFFEILNEQGDEMLEMIARSSSTGVVA